MTRGQLLFVLVLAFVLACGGDDAAPDAGGTPDAASDAGAEPPFDIPWLGRGDPIEWGPCPSGWRMITSEAGTESCDAWPVSGPQTCPMGEAHFPGEPGCSRIGTACPSDGVPADLPTGSVVVHVRAGAAGGDGTRARPFGTFAEASPSIAAGTIVAMHAGTLDEVISLPAGVTLWGACVSDTVLTATTPDLLSGIVTVSGEGAAVRNLSLARSPRPGLWVRDGSSVAIDGVWIEETEATGLIVDGGAAVVESLVVRRVRMRRDEVETTDGESGNGIVAKAGGSLMLSRVFVDGNREYGVYGRDAGTRVDMVGSRVEGTIARTGPRTFNGDGFVLDYEATGSIRRSVFTNNESAGGPRVYGATLVIEDVVVTGGKVGLVASEDGVLEATRVRLEHVSQHGIYTIYGSPLIRLHDVIVRDVHEERTHRMGVGIWNTPLGAGRIEATRVLIERARAGGIAMDSGSAVLTDVAIRDVYGGADGPSGAGLSARYGAEVTATRVSIENTSGAAVNVREGARLDARDLHARNTVEWSCGLEVCDVRLGTGLSAYNDATLVVAGFHVDTSATCGIHIALGSMIDLTRGIVENNPIGACVQVDGYDVTRLQNDVAYRSNGTNLDATTLPIPELTEIE